MVGWGSLHVMEMLCMVRWVHCISCEFWAPIFWTSLHCIAYTTISGSLKLILKLCIYTHTYERVLRVKSVFRNISHMDQIFMFIVLLISLRNIGALLRVCRCGWWFQLSYSYCYHTWYIMGDNYHSQGHKAPNLEGSWTVGWPMRHWLS